MASLIAIVALRSRGEQPPAASPLAASAPSASASAQPPCKMTPGMDPARTVAVLPAMPRYPGAEIRTSLDLGPGTATVTLETCDKIDDVIAFYRAVRGLQSDGERERADGRELFFSRPGEAYRVEVSQGSGATRIHVTTPPAPERPASDAGSRTKPGGPLADGGVDPRSDLF